VDLDTSPPQSDENLRPLNNRTSRAQFLAFQASTVSVHAPLWLYFEPQKLLNLDLYADTDTAFHSNADPDPAFENNADTCGSRSPTLFLNIFS
jgi:hypothetical protein